MHHHGRMLPRLQLFEFNDSPWVPVALRAGIIESLSRTLELGRMLEGLVGPFKTFLEKSKAQQVIDLAAGAGSPARVLLRELSAANVALPKFVITDLLPAVEAWAAVKAEFAPGVVEFVAQPVDITAIPAHLTGARLVINALHHFPPALAKRALLGACENSPGVFVAEGLVRNPLSFAAMAPHGVCALMADPVLGSSHRVQRALFTWFSPLAIAASVWDGTVSSFRCYSEAELREFVAPLGNSWSWEFDEYEVNRLGRGTYFYGLPNRT